MSTPSVSPYLGRFAGRTAVITGGASGLGRAVAARIVAEGGQVSLWDLDAAALKDAAAEVGDCQDLEMFLDLNGKRMQTGNSKTMIFGVAECIAYMSRFITLEPGDILTTGPPPGVGEGQKPDKIFLKAGDVMTLGVQKLGEQQQTVIAWTQEGVA